MKVEIYKDAKLPLDPSEVIENVWYVKLICNQNTITLRVTDYKDELVLSVNSQLVVLPKAANSIEIKELGY
jgi:hypothetical protein